MNALECRTLAAICMHESCACIAWLTVYVRLFNIRNIDLHTVHLKYDYCTVQVSSESVHDQILGVRERHLGRSLYRVGAKPGLWTLDWTHGLDCGLRFGFDFGMMRRAMMTISKRLYYGKKVRYYNCKLG